MKKISFLLLSVVTLLLTACAEAKYEMHQTYFYPQRPDGMKFYADQTYDSTKVFSYDPWTAEIEATNQWFTITPTSCEARPGTSALTRMDVRMEQNITGKNYKGRIVVKTYDNNTIAMPVFQSSWLNIMYPTPTITGDTYETQTALFNLSVNATEKAMAITFHVYQDGARLSSDSPWATPEATTFNKGQHSVKIKFDPNTDTNERKAMFILTSGNISTPIYITQSGKKEEDKK